MICYKQVLNKTILMLMMCLYEIGRSVNENLVLVIRLHIHNISEVILYWLFDMPRFYHMPTPVA